MAFGNYYGSTMGAYPPPYYQPSAPMNMPTAYQQRQTQPQPIQTAQPQQNNGGVIWVQGIEGAKAYPLAPGSQPVALFDSEKQTVYIKSCDFSGIPSLEAFNLTKSEPKAQEPINGEIYATKEELKAIEDKLETLFAKQTTPTKKPAKEVKDNG